ncbi:MAG: hypothetical protein EP346_05845 [Bacteroidetes bacterium]|nr:MAG: hypothetical protein EP346_05845 [Bacteroidota bacterium]
MKPLILISLLCIASLASCKKDEMTTVAEGHVYEVNSTTPVPGAKVYIARIKKYRFNTRFFNLDSTISNDKGKYYIKSTSSNIDLILYAEKEGYYNMLEDRHHLTKVTPGENNHRNVYPIPPAWVRINYDQLDPTHGVYINPIPGGRVDGIELISDTSVIARIWGSSKVELNTFHFVNGDLLSHEEEFVMTGSHDTTDVDISF